MVADYSIVHRENEKIPVNRELWMAYASIMIAIYPFGIPFVFGVLLYRNRHALCPELRERKNNNKPLSFLFLRDHYKDEIKYVRGADRPSKDKEGEGGNELQAAGTEEVQMEDDEAKRKQLDVLVGPYQRRAFWFEVLECIRRLALSSLLIMIHDGSVAQIVVAICACLVSIKVYSYYTPYAHGDDDILTEVTQYQLFSAFFAALLIRVDATSDRPEDQRNLSVALIFISSAGFIVMGVTLAYIVLKKNKPDGAEDEEGGSARETSEKAPAAAAAVPATSDAEEPDTGTRMPSSENQEEGTESSGGENEHKQGSSHHSGSAQTNLISCFCLFRRTL
jgi:hypothetical protein